MKKIFKSTYVLASHSLADNLGVLIDEDVGLGAGGIKSSHGEVHEGGFVKHLLGCGESL